MRGESGKRSPSMGCSAAAQRGRFGGVGIGEHLPRHRDLGQLERQSEVALDRFRARAGGGPRSEPAAWQVVHYQFTAACDRSNQRDDLAAIMAALRRLGLCSANPVRKKHAGRAFFGAGLEIRLPPSRYIPSNPETWLV